MNTLQIIWILVFLIYVAIYNGLYLREMDERGKSNFEVAKKWNIIWHGWGSLLRAGAVVLLIPVFWNNWKEFILWVLVIGTISWIVYDMIINLIRNRSLFYKGEKKTGTKSFIDRFLPNWLYWGLKGLLLIATITYIIIS